MSIGKKILALLVLFSTVVVMLVLFIIGGTKVVSTGSYGPFTIGEEKSRSASTLERLGVWPPQPVPFHNTLLEAPTIAELQRIFSEDNGIVVWFGQSAGVPMRLEFAGDTLDRMWPTFEPRRGSNPNPGYDAIDDAMLSFQNQIAIGISRNDVFERIASQDTGLTAYVSTHVVREDTFDDLSYEQAQVDPSYSGFIYEQRGWRFTGLDHLLWYSGFATPHYSRVSLFFDREKLARIEHSHGPIELP
ncbi:hypothetical protein [Sulfitobacter sp. 20_GPM-1509m]|uniref:hypothetical protein n=1 Tax=Sulfitobacter sp. 20_GPM-1509m TaxID=1380367 RepID=UPI00048BB378|nr:hypothetical protein [Sulfitobacter sp. 20_GPM-1509m]